LAAEKIDTDFLAISVDIGVFKTSYILYVMMLKMILLLDSAGGGGFGGENDDDDDFKDDNDDYDDDVYTFHYVSHFVLFRTR